MPARPTGSKPVRLRGGAWAVRVRIVKPGSAIARRERLDDRRGRKLLVLEGCMTEEEATVRARELALTASRLLRCGREQDAVNTARILAAATSQKRRESILHGVEELVAGKLEPISTSAPELTFRKFAESCEVDPEFRTRG